MKLIATRNVRYRTRQMKAGEELDVPDILGSILLKKKRKFRKASEASVSVQPKSQAQNPDIDKLRSQAESAGVQVDRRWGPRRLASEINKPGGTVR